MKKGSDLTNTPLGKRCAESNIEEKEDNAFPLKIAIGCDRKILLKQKSDASVIVQNPGIEHPVRPCSALAPTAEMLTMLQSLPRTLKELQTIKGRQTRIESSPPARHTPCACPVGVRPVKQTKAPVVLTGPPLVLKVLGPQQIKDIPIFSVADVHSLDQEDKGVKKLEDEHSAVQEDKRVKRLEDEHPAVQEDKRVKTLQDKHSAGRVGKRFKTLQDTHSAGQEDKRVITLQDKLSVETLILEVERLKKENEVAVKLAEERLSKIQQLDTRVCTLLRREKELYDELEVKKSQLLYQGISKSDSKLSFYSGLPNADTFNWLLGILNEPEASKYHLRWRPSVSKEDKVFMTLMRLKTNFSKQVLTDWFNISRTAVLNIERTWIEVLHKEFYLEVFVKLPAERNFEAPECHTNFGFVEVVKDIKHGAKCEPLKGMLGVTSTGCITFASELFPRTTSNEDIMHSCGVLQCLLPGDVVLLDSGFVVTEDMCLSDEPVENYVQDDKDGRLMTISRGSVEIEKAHDKIKDFSMLNSIPYSLTCVASKIWQICAALTSLRHQKSSAWKQTRAQVFPVDNVK